MKKIILSILLLLQVLAHSSQINVGSLNLRWFGLGGEMSGELEDEFRDKWIKEFLRPSLQKLDVITFQEIVDFERLQKLMKSFNFFCLSYKNTYYKHQKVATCYKHNKYIHQELASYPNFIIEEIGSVDNRKLRPALIFKLLNKKTKKLEAIITALHLKASTDKKSALTRLAQIDILENVTASLKGYPVVILGDFNTHQKEDTSLERDDIDLYKDILSTSNLKYVKNHTGVTYKVKGSSKHLDHIFVSNSIIATATRVNDACRLSPRNKKRFQNYLFYNRFISDHCLIESTLTLK